MPGKIWDRDPLEWQAYVLQLLRLRYTETQFQEIPDRDRGDCGLEGFSRDGVAYQCYAAEEPLSTQELTRKQRSKIGKDTKKFVEKRDELGKILGHTRISRWILVVPRWESKELQKHAEKRADVVRQAQLPYATTDFCIHIATLDDFVLERGKLLDIGADRLRLVPDEFKAKELKDWAEEHDKLVQSLDRKIRKLNGEMSSAARLIVRDEFIRFFVEGQNVLEKLHVDHPELYAQIMRTKHDRARFLATITMIPSQTPAESLKEVLQRFEQELGNHAAGLSPHTIETLVHEAVSDWLLRCPLDFPGKGSDDE